VARRVARVVTGKPAVVSDGALRGVALVYVWQRWQWSATAHHERRRFSGRGLAPKGGLPLGLLAQVGIQVLFTDDPTHGLASQQQYRRCSASHSRCLHHI
jgi:hypothetical protein